MSHSSVSFSSVKPASNRRRLHSSTTDKTKSDARFKISKLSIHWCLDVSWVPDITAFHHPLFFTNWVCFLLLSCICNTGCGKLEVTVPKQDTSWNICLLCRDSILSEAQSLVLTCTASRLGPFFMLTCLFVCTLDNRELCIRISTAASLLLSFLSNRTQRLVWTVNLKWYK